MPRRYSRETCSCTPRRQCGDFHHGIIDEGRRRGACLSKGKSSNPANLVQRIRLDERALKPPPTCSLTGGVSWSTAPSVPTRLHRLLTANAQSPHASVTECHCHGSIFNPRIPLTASLVDNYPILPTNITDGRNLQAGDSGVVLLSENNSAYFGAGVGDAVTILGQSFTVVGIYSPSSVSETQTLYMNLSDAQAITNNTGYITSLTVFAQSSGVVSQVASSISSLHPELTVTTCSSSRKHTFNRGIDL